MIIKGNYEKKIQIIRSKLPGLNILRKNEREWEITGKELNDREKKEIVRILDIEKEKESEVKTMSNQQIPAQQPIAQPQQPAQNFNGSSTDLVIRGLAMMIEPIMQDVAKLKEVDKQHADARYNFENSTAKHFSAQDQTIQEMQKNQIVMQARIDELERDYAEELEKTNSWLSKELENLKERKEKMLAKVQKMQAKKEQQV